MSTAVSEEDADSISGSTIYQTEAVRKYVSLLHDAAHFMASCGRTFD
jgi:hypothetical protein